ncbi:MAG TPA: DUF4331 domain-containing protein [Streptosporangiaceae bacterium]|nr:DUF4331 domain-containing protein [Streptosporangiaceae bacterium]
MRTTRTRRPGAALAALGLALAAGVAILGPAGARASSHREAPLIAADPAVDNTDVYAFVSPDRPGYVTFVANFIPFEEPNGGPNFYPFAKDAIYNINIDNNGDAKPDAVFRWKFHDVDKRGGSTFLYNNGPVTSITDPNLLFRQTYTLQSSFHGEPFQTRVANAPVAPSRVGPASMPNYAKLRNQAVTKLAGGWKIFAGQADDPFFLDLRVFDLLYGGNLKETGQDTLAGYNVNTLAIQVPFKDVALGGDPARNPNIGIWSTAERPRVRITGKTGTSTRGWVQVSRLGNPLVNEVVVPANLKDAFNALPPVKDASIAPVVARVKDPEVPKLIQGIYGIKAPAIPRNDLVEIFLTGITKKAGGPIKADLNSQLNNADVSPAAFRPSEMLRLNLSIKPTANPNRLGVLGGDLQGFPNGRRLTDDVVDIELQALEGAAQTGKLVPALAAGDGVNANDRAFAKSFPYVALPNVGAVNKGGGTASSASPAAAAPARHGSTPPAEQSISTEQTAYSPGVTADTVIIATIGAVAVALAAVLIVGWVMRRRPPAIVAAAGQCPPPPSPAIGSGEPTVEL